MYGFLGNVIVPFVRTLPGRPGAIPTLSDRVQYDVDEMMCIKCRNQNSPEAMGSLGLRPAATPKSGYGIRFY
jgi:hypothetical protein